MREPVRSGAEPQIQYQGRRVETMVFHDLSLENDVSSLTLDSTHARMDMSHR